MSLQPVEHSSLRRNPPATLQKNQKRLKKTKRSKQPQKRFRKPGLVLFAVVGCFEGRSMCECLFVYCDIVVVVDSGSAKRMLRRGGLMVLARHPSAVSWCVLSL